MCYQIIEKFAVCGCLYCKHAVDPCARYGLRDHTVQERVILVGYTCPRHSLQQSYHYERFREGVQL